MKKTFLLLYVVLAGTLATAQTCVRDSSIYGLDTIVSPYPWTPTAPLINTVPACLGEPYSQSVTFNVPDSIETPGLPKLAINNISIATSGAVSGLPAGITYLCDPPNCVFNKFTLGCLLLYGTPTAANPAPDTVEVSITTAVNSPLFPIPINVQFPSVIAPDNHYYIRVLPMGLCVSGTVDPSGQLTAVKNAPNPFSDFTNIAVESMVTAAFQFDVFDLLGQCIYTEKINLLTGPNEFTFAAGDLANGTYYFSIGNAAGKATRMMVIAR